MSIESNADGTDIFWPGYVDAVTNLVLNLLFMLTIMIVAVFMFALELSRHKDDKPVPVVETPAADNKQKIPNKDIVVQAISSRDNEIMVLQKQLESLKKQMQEQNRLTGTQKIIIAKTPMQRPDKTLNQPSSAGGGIVVNFMQEAVTLSATEAETLRGSLSTIVASGAAKIDVLVPEGFSEAKRLGFYRAMAVRNQLIEMKMPANKIEVSVREGKANADNSKVMVSPR